MTAHAVPRRTHRANARRLGTLPFAALAALSGLALAALCFVAYVLWPTWPSKVVPIDAPAIPITVSGVLFDIPPAAIRAAVQRTPGPHERVDLTFMWPSLTPPLPQGKNADKPPIKPDSEAAAAPAGTNERLFVTIAALGTLLPPLERLRGIYPRYVEVEADAGPDGLAILPFRKGTPYEGEDLIYVSGNPEQFFARCTRDARGVPGSCLHERLIGTAEITLRFSRQWLEDWRRVAAGIDRLLAQLHPG
jgi:hypothetical protein